MKTWAGILICCALLCGCEADRLSKLKKENADLKSKVEKRDAAVDYDLQARCSKDARAWFNENWLRDKDTFILDYTNHYDAKLNKCFILVEYHYNSAFHPLNGSAWANDLTLIDVHENAKYAKFAERHVTNMEPTISVVNEVITCEAVGKKCNTNDEFYKLIGPYMND